jgi:hypothetical protein
MKPSSGRPKEGLLVVLVLLCFGYAALMQFHLRLSGTAQIDGIFGVLLGLYSASQPASNILDLILYGRYESVRATYRHASRRFWLLNLFVLLAGWAVISSSLLRYSHLV